jgi:hypothetical protein
MMIQFTMEEGQVTEAVSLYGPLEHHHDPG